MKKILSLIAIGLMAFINATVYPGSNNVGSISAGTYTVTMYASYGEHDYIFNGIHQTTIMARQLSLTWSSIKM